MYALKILNNDASLANFSEVEMRKRKKHGFKVDMANFPSFINASCQSFGTMLHYIPNNLRIIAESYPVKMGSFFSKRKLQKNKIMFRRIVRFWYKSAK